MIILTTSVLDGSGAGYLFIALIFTLLLLVLCLGIIIGRCE